MSTLCRHRIPIVFTLAITIAGGFRAAQATGGSEKPKPCTQSKAAILEYGLARTAVVELVPIDPARTAAAHLFRPDGYEFIRKTRDIPLESGNWIYIHYKVEGVRMDRQPRMKYVVTHPQMTSPEGRSFTRYADEFSPAASSFEDVFGWGFDERFPFEFVTGAWRFQLWEGNCLLFNEEFRTHR